MKNAKKGFIIAGVILALTLGIASIRILFFPPGGFYFGLPTDFILLGPALPFLTLIWIFPNNIGMVTIISFILAIAFWLFVGYGIGRWMDKRKK
jgi:H+/gluconate symporter-like permease